MGNRHAKHQQQPPSSSSPPSSRLTTADVLLVGPSSFSSSPLPPSPGKVGMHGPPGVGKSQFVNVLEKRYLVTEKKGGGEESFKMEIEVDGEMVSLVVETKKNPRKDFGDTCAICRISLFDLCLECEATSPEDRSESCAIAVGVCDHQYHFHCISMWLRNRDVCPLDNITWEFAKYTAREEKKDEQEPEYSIKINDNNSVFVIVYDCEDAMYQVDAFLKKIKQIDPPVEPGKIFLVENKCDLRESPIPGGEEKAGEFAPPLPFYRVSALSGEGTDELFYDVARVASGKIGKSIKGAQR
eukprot:CAMPEP_0201508318 /NCGR_PEP_ID=MMETSP0161_2-20130828/1722_1 /ASSEMBLY_ACC=CAM_ASM_000251 /TAXON_ID=180227 /ORGANISM="Neoparamoeba aestuarina, Strain SoJaBio B1-5/56/2" /LENGTH=297 /DNA_ID=CAMNT_0047902951 /DNA_START=617 /DNA_END=1510 /DNA_ORIENTATION=-